jgi:hypothetical protein
MEDVSVVAAVDLYWLPLGAGGHCVRLCGMGFEAVTARVDRRARCALYHSALLVQAAGGTYAVEQTPVPTGDERERGVVAGGAVGTRRAGRFRMFRYEIRRWKDGTIADLAAAVESPRRLTEDLDTAERLLALVPRVPTPVWGRDQLGLDEMWNSNSVISWLLVQSGLHPEPMEPPRGGRAPGWRAGIIAARSAPASWPSRSHGRAGA